MLGVLLQRSSELRIKCVGGRCGSVVARILVTSGAEVVRQSRGRGQSHVYPEFEARDALGYCHDFGLAVRRVLPCANFGHKTERCHDPHYAN